VTAATYPVGDSRTEVPTICDTCGAAPCVNPSFCAASRKLEAQRRFPRRSRADQSIPHDWDRMSLDALWEFFNRRRPTPQTSIEAVMLCVRERGIAVLEEPANLERLSRCDASARAEINARIARLIEEKACPA
jgi:hypothetical protein